MKVLNNWKAIRKARREKRRRLAEEARRKLEMGARAVISYATRDRDGWPDHKLDTPYTRKAREEAEQWPTFV